MKYLLYDIQYNEQFFKQLAGFFYFLRDSINHKLTLVLPNFRTLPKDKNNLTIKNDQNFGYHTWDKFYDVESMKKKFNVITIEEFKKLDLPIDILFSRTNRFCGDNFIKISDIEFKFKKRDTETKFGYNKLYDQGDVIAICGTTSQLPYNTSSYMKYRLNIRYHQKYYDEIQKLLEEKNIEKYIAVHWRQTDFLRVRKSRSDVLNTPEELVEKCKKIMKETGINNIYLATDSKDYAKLKYINDNLPLFFLNSINKEYRNDKYIYAVMESIICAKATHFYGTRTSLYSVNICGERGALGLDNKQYYI